MGRAPSAHTLGLRVPPLRPRGTERRPSRWPCGLASRFLPRWTWGHPRARPQALHAATGRREEAGSAAAWRYGDSVQMRGWGAQAGGAASARGACAPLTKDTASPAMGGKCEVPPVGSATRGEQALRAAGRSTLGQGRDRAGPRTRLHRGPRCTSGTPLLSPLEPTRDSDSAGKAHPRPQAHVAAVYSQTRFKDLGAHSGEAVAMLLVFPLRLHRLNISLKSPNANNQTDRTSDLKETARPRTRDGYERVIISGAKANGTTPAPRPRPCPCPRPRVRESGFRSSSPAPGSRCNLLASSASSDT